MAAQTRKNLLVILAAFLLAYLALVVAIHYGARDYALRESEKSIQDALLTHRAIHSYVEEIQKPEIYRLKKAGQLYEDYFSPKILSFTYIARNIKVFQNKERVKEGLPEIYFKLATDNPRNPINKADAFESELLRQMNEDGLKQYKRVGEKDGQPFLYFAIPINPSQESCMRCHSDPAKAPRELIEQYGDQAGFWETPGKARAMISMRVPLEGLYSDAARYTAVLSGVALVLFTAIYGLIAFFMRRLDAQQQLINDINAGLEARVASEIARNRAQEDLLIQQSRLAAMGEMIGNIAHQWRQPINALTLLLANIKDAYDFDELDRDYLDKEIRAGQELIQKMSTTIDDFRDFFRPNKEKQDFAVAAAVEEAVKLVAHSLRNANIQVTVSGAEHPDIANGYPNEFAQVVVNALSNAKEAILSSATSGRIDIAIGSEGERIGVAIRDSGPGIPAEILGKVFEPYFTTKEKGTGIGLYMSKTIMEHMGGEITLNNVEGGAELRLGLPRAEK